MSSLLAGESTTLLPELKLGPHFSLTRYCPSLIDRYKELASSLNLDDTTHSDNPLAGRGAGERRNPILKHTLPACVSNNIPEQPGIKRFFKTHCWADGQEEAELERNLWVLKQGVSRVRFCDAHDCRQ